MALGNVFITDTDGRLPSATSTSNEKITGLLFDVSKQPELFTAGYGKSNESKLKLGDVCIQAITQLQEQTLTFGVKLLAVVLTLFIMGGWLSGEILRYADDIFSRFYMIR